MPRLRPTLNRLLHALGPVAVVPLPEAIRAAVGALIGLALAMLLPLLAARMAGAHPATQFMLVAPFGATAVLVFAAPNSPLAQPWPAIIGNLSSSLIAIAVTSVVSNTAVAAPLAVGLAILTMALCRATHPPGGAVALLIALAAAEAPVNPMFAVMPVAVGTVLLVAVGSVYARATGRRYPFRHVHDPNRVDTTDPEPIERIGLSEEQLAGILARYRQSLNLGVEDLARLISAAEVEAAGQRAGRTAAAEIMSRDLVTVSPDASLREVAELFVHHGFTSLPVTRADGIFCGVIFQLHLLSHLNDAAHGGRGAMMRAAQQILGRRPAGPLQRAADVMDETPVTTSPDVPISALLSPLAVQGIAALPVLDGPRLVGIVTQTDLIAALATHSMAPAEPAAAPLPLPGENP